MNLNKILKEVDDRGDCFSYDDPLGEIPREFAEWWAYSLFEKNANGNLISPKNENLSVENLAVFFTQKEIVCLYILMPFVYAIDCCMYSEAKVLYRDDESTKDLIRRLEQEKTKTSSWIRESEEALF